MRFRADDRWIAEAKALGRPYKDYFGTRKKWDSTPAAEPGDTWRILFYAPKGEPKDRLAGYDIACPKCRHVHGWTSARNCGSRRERIIGGETYTMCDHQVAREPCWTWTGSAEDGTLSASPSLHCDASIGGCGYHGFLTNGVLSDG